jgi:hypothetical protein
MSGLPGKQTLADRRLRTNKRTSMSTGQQAAKRPAKAANKAAAKPPTIRLDRLTPEQLQRVLACGSRQEFNRFAAEFQAGKPANRRS